MRIYFDRPIRDYELLTWYRWVTSLYATKDQPHVPQSMCQDAGNMGEDLYWFLVLLVRTIRTKHEKEMSCFLLGLVWGLCHRSRIFINLVSSKGYFKNYRLWEMRNEKYPSVIPSFLLHQVVNIGLSSKGWGFSKSLCNHLQLMGGKRTCYVMYQQRLPKNQTA